MISIVMPCYNCETSLVRTAECIQAQTVADWELIAVDDGSSDGTGAALDALARADARIRVIHQENGGVSRARNAGMAAARGEWLAARASTLIWWSTPTRVHPRWTRLKFSISPEMAGLYGR